MKIMSVVGARPNFMKISPLMRAFRKRGKLIESVLVHTGQHYDEAMSRTFFEQLQIPVPDINLGVGSGTHAQQTARIMTGFERLLDRYRPDVVLVVGDVNSTLACTVTAAKAGIMTAHVEAGLRSFDMSMPEEINRKVTDSICDLFFTTEKSANSNLKAEGIKKDRIFFVGNVMADTLFYYIDRIKHMPLPVKGISDGCYATVTLHRPSNVDDPVVLGGIFTALESIQKELPVVFSMHPRTMKQMNRTGLLKRIAGMRSLIVTQPLGYLEFLRLNRSAKLVLTDSGGLQEETTCLGVPCLTLRENTERPVTVEVGTNVLTGPDPSAILKAFGKIMKGSFKRGRVPALWDGRAADRIADILVKWA
jgi:UDP-N-acetylglucosamine 2-epimerase (non-hydrolysing)